MKEMFISCNLAPGIGERDERDVERAFAETAELGKGLHQRGVGVDLEIQLAAGALAYLVGEAAAHAVAEVAAVAGAGGELVADAEGAGGGAGVAGECGQGQGAQGGAAGQGRHRFAPSWAAASRPR